MCDICKQSREKLEKLVTEEMQANAIAHNAEYRYSDDIRVLIDILCVKFYERGALDLLPRVVIAAAKQWAMLQAEAAAEQEADLQGIVLSPAPKLVQ